MDEKEGAYFQGNHIPDGSSDTEGNVIENDSTETATEESSSTETAVDAKAQDQAAKPQEDKHDWEKSYKHLQRKYTRDSQALSQREQEIQKYQAMQAEYERYKQIDAMLGQDPEAMQFLQNRFQGKQPNPYESKIAEHDKWIQGQQTRERTMQAETYLDKEINQAASEYEKMFGAKMTKEDEFEILSYMNKENIYKGKTAVRDLYYDKYADNKAQRLLNDQQAKKGIGTRTQKVNSNSAATKSDHFDNIRDAWEASLQELRAKS